jgi:hypothetical protein
MFKRIFAVAAAASLSVLGATAAAQAQAQPQARPGGHLHGVRVVNLHRAFEAQLRHTKVGKISGIVYAKGHRPKAAANTAATCTEPQCPVTWQGGLVQHTPHVYLLLWGPNWTTDTTTASYLQNFFSGLGVAPDDNWSTITSQYADTTGVPTFSGSVFAGVFTDTSVPPHNTSLFQIGAEADTFAQNQGITDLNDAEIIVATQSGTCPQGFQGTGCTGGTLQRDECGYHSSSNQPFINLPYEPDAGTSCEENFVNPTGTDDGFSIIGGALYAGTITDPFGTAWFDTATGGEIGDQCAGIPAGSPGGAFNQTLSTGTFAMEDLWSNAAGGCAPTGAVKDSIKITSPGNQTNNVGDTVNLPIVGSSTAGNPLAWTQTGLPNGLTINTMTGTVSGQPTTAGTSSVKVTAKDETGAKQSVAFTWTINNAVTAKPITGDHGKCLDDFGGSTTNGNKVDIWTCNNTSSQQWTFVNGGLSVLGKCLDDSSQGGAGAKLVVWTCNGHAAQFWTHKSNGEYVLKLNGLCLTDPSGSATDGTQVVIRKCSAFADQTWTLPS